MANLELRGSYGLNPTRTGNSYGRDAADAARRRQMQAEESIRMLREQEYNIMRTAHLEADLVAQEKAEADEEIYYLLS